MKRIYIDEDEVNCRVNGRVVIIKEKSCKHIMGCFDLNRAPVISQAMRSTDLAKIIDDIFKRKGIKPRKQ